MKSKAAIGKFEYRFQWFPENDAALLSHLAKFKGRSDITGVEVGSWEGRSACWMLTNVIDGPNGHLHCIDPWDAPIGKEIEARFDRNISAAEDVSLGRITKHKGRSVDVLPRLPVSGLHFAYIDGSHIAADVLSDMVLAWRLLRVGGVMVCDDYELTQGIEFHDNGETFPEVPPLERPKMAIDAFLACFQGKYVLLHRGWQVIIEKGDP